MYADCRSKSLPSKICKRSRKPAASPRLQAGSSKQNKQTLPITTFCWLPEPPIRGQWIKPPGCPMATAGQTETARFGQAHFAVRVQFFCPCLRKQLGYNVDLFKCTDFSYSNGTNHQTAPLSMRLAFAALPAAEAVRNLAQQCGSGGGNPSACSRTELCCVGDSEEIIRWLADYHNLPIRLPLYFGDAYTVRSVLFASPAAWIRWCWADCSSFSDRLRMRSGLLKSRKVWVRNSMPCSKYLFCC